MMGTILGVTGVGVSSAVIAGSGVTGTARTVLDIVPTMQATGILRKYSKKSKFL